MNWRSLPRFIHPGVLITLVLTLCGCGRGTAVSPTTPVTSDASPPESTPYITLIMPEARSQSMDSYEQDAMMFAGEERAMFRLERPDKGAPASRQAELIENAIADGASAIIILPQDPETVRPALEVARERGISVVVLNNPVKAAADPFTLVTQPSIAESSRPMIEAVLLGVKKSKLSPKGPAVLVVNRDPTDNVAEVRTEGLRKALNAAGITDISVVDFVEKGISDDEIYRQAVDRTPRPTMVFATDDTSLTALARARHTDVEHNLKAPVLGGLASMRGGFGMVKSNQVASAVDVRSRPLLEQAILAAIEQSRGETVKPTILVERPVLVAPILREAMRAQVKADTSE